MVAIGCCDYISDIVLLTVTCTKVLFCLVGGKRCSRFLKADGEAQALPRWG